MGPYDSLKRVGHLDAIGKMGEMVMGKDSLEWFQRASQLLDTVFDLRIWIASAPAFRGMVADEVVRRQPRRDHAKIGLEVDVLRQNGQPWPDEMELDEVRRRIAADPNETLHIVLRGGGMKQKIPEPELV